MLEKILAGGAWLALILFMFWGAVSMSRAPRERISLYDKIMLWYSLGVLVLLGSIVVLYWR